MQLLLFYAAVFLSFLWEDVEGSGGCSGVEFEDPMLGTLVPCTHPNAQGMLCVKEIPDIVVWPGRNESDTLSTCGINIGDSESSRVRRKRKAFTCRSLAECRRKRRKKREGSEDSLELTDHLSEGYNYQKMLRDLVRMEYGKQGVIELDPAAELFLKTKLQLEGNSQRGIYRALVGPASQFDPEAKNKARDTILKLLKGKAKKEDWGWLDVERMGRELEMCYYADYSAVTNQDVFFTTPKQNVQLQVGTNQSRSTFGYWYFKVVCMRDGGRVFLTTVIYTDQMRLKDIQKTVDYWRNNPETVTKFIKGSRQRLVQAVRSQTVKDRTTQTGQSCYTKKKGWWRKKRRKRICNRWTNHKDHAKRLDLIKQHILTDVTSKKFIFEVNKWIKDTKEVMEKRTLTLKERENLKDWIQNTVLAEVMHHFSQFFDDPLANETSIEGEDGETDEETPTDESSFEDDDFIVDG